MKWLSKIKELASLITAASVVIGIIWGAFAFVSRTSDQAEILEEIKAQQTAVADSIHSLSVRVEDMSLLVEGVSDNTILIGNYVEGVNRALRYHLEHSPEVTKDDYAAIMQIVEELKKKEPPTPLRENTE